MKIECLTRIAKTIRPHNTRANRVLYPVKNLAIMLRYFQRNPHPKSKPFFLVRFDARHDSAICIKKSGYICSFNFRTLLSYGVSSHTPSITTWDLRNKRFCA